MARREKTVADFAALPEPSRAAPAIQSFRRDFASAFIVTGPGFEDRIRIRTRPIIAIPTNAHVINRTIVANKSKLRATLNRMEVAK